MRLRVDLARLAVDDLGDGNRHAFFANHLRSRPEQNATTASHQKQIGRHPSRTPVFANGRRQRVFGERD